LVLFLLPLAVAFPLSAVAVSIFGGNGYVKSSAGTQSDDTFSVADTSDPLSTGIYNLWVDAGEYATYVFVGDHWMGRSNANDNTLFRIGDGHTSAAIAVNFLEEAEYRFSHFANNSTSTTHNYDAGFGRGLLNGTTTGQHCNVTLSFDNAKVTWKESVSHATGQPIGYAWGTIFGAGQLFKNSSGSWQNDSFCNWKFSNIGNNSVFSNCVKNNRSTGSVFASVFGAGDVQHADNAFLGWVIDGIGAGTRIAVCATTNSGNTDPEGGTFHYFGGGTETPFGSGLYNGDGPKGYNCANATIFGSAFTNVYNYSNTASLQEERIALSGWQITGLGDGIALTAIAALPLGTDGLRSVNVAVFGGAYGDEKTPCYEDWIVQFDGSATVAAFGQGDYDTNEGSFCPSKVHVAALGGYRNSAMRFFFHNADGAHSSVVLAGIKLGGDWDGGTFTFSKCQGTEDDYDLPDDGWGDNIANANEYGYSSSTSSHNNAGWARAVAVGPDFLFDVGHMASFTKPANEIGYYGSPAKQWHGWSLADRDEAYGSGSGDMYVLGAIAQGRWCSHTEGSLLSIDNGWSVYCFAPVQDLETIELLDGRLVLVNSVGAPGVLAGDPNAEDLFATACGQLEDNISIATTTGISDASCTVDADNYPILGKLKINADQKLIFHVNDQESGDIPGYTLTKGALEILVDGDATAPALTLATGAKIAIVDDADWEDSDNSTLVDGSAFWIVRMPGGVDANEKLLLWDTTPELGLIDGATIDSDDPYAEWQNLGLYYVDEAEDGGACGLVARASDWTMPVALVPTGYARSYASCQQALAFCSVHDPIQEFLQGRCNDCHICHGNDPFVVPFGGHEKRKLDPVAGFASSLRFGGVAVGEDRLLPFWNGTVRFGGAASYAIGKIRYKGPSTGLAKKTESDHYFADAFVGYEWQDSFSRKTNVYGTLSFHHAMNWLSRVDDDGDAYRARSHENGMHVETGTVTVQILNAIPHMQLGTFLSAAYDWVKQSAYSESGGEGAASLSDLRHHIVHSEAGIATEYDAGRIHYNGRVAWRYRCFQDHSHAFGSIEGEPYGKFDPIVGYGRRNALVFAGSLRARLGAHWEVRSNWKSLLIAGINNFSGSVTFGYYF
jgi:hypothetical protein